MMGLSIRWRRIWDAPRVPFRSWRQDSKARSSIRGWAGSQVSAVAIRRNGPTGCEGQPAPFAAANSGFMAHLGHTVAVRDFERMTRALGHEARRPFETARCPANVTTYP